MQQETLIVQFKLLFQHFSGRTLENHKNRQINILSGI